MTPLATETELKWQFIATVPFALANVLVFDRPILHVQATAKGRTWHQRAGVPGQADAYAVARGGLHVELEMKSARGVVAEKQELWRRRCERLRVPHLVLRARKNELPADTVMRWIEELRAAIREADWRHLPP